MKTSFIWMPVLFTMIVGCGEDVSSNRRRGTPGQERNTSEVNGNGGLDGTRSQVHRRTAAPVLSYSEEIAQTLNNSLSDVLYRIVPLMETDDESSALTIQELGRPKKVCGIADTLQGVDSRITDCFQKNGNLSLWEGSRYGTSGEGIWKLVSRNADGREIWFDTRTGMAWSDIITIDGAASFNWCQASGNIENDTPSTTTDCNDIAAGISTCVGKTDGDIGVNVKWRLPTRNDLLQADLNGARAVLKKESSLGLWTATLKSGVSGRNEAWIYKSADGTLTNDVLSSKYHVRCIGAPIR